MKLVLMMALTADGKIGRHSDHFPDWTEPEDKKRFMSTSREAGVIILGGRTFDTFEKPLPHRKHVVLTRNRERRSLWGTQVVFTDKTPGEILKDLTAEGFETAVLAGGSQINTLFARENLIDEIILTWSPILFGEGISLFSEPVQMTLELLAHCRIGENSLLAKYRVIK